MTWQDECKLIIDAAHVAGVDPRFVAAIRKQENGASGREFGVLSVPAKGYDAQLRVTCRSVAHRLHSYYDDVMDSPLRKTKDDTVYSDDFIEYFGNIWSPVGARNDPRSLNKNWIANVRKLYARACREGITALG